MQHVVDGLVDLGDLPGLPLPAWPDHEVDGVAELQFATEADFAERFFDSDEGAAAIMADVDRFLDLSRTRGALVTPPSWPPAEPRPRRAARSSGCQVVGLARRDDGPGSPVRRRLRSSTCAHGRVASIRARGWWSGVTCST